MFYTATCCIFYKLYTQSWSHQIFVHGALHVLYVSMYQGTPALAFKNILFLIFLSELRLIYPLKYKTTNSSMSILYTVWESGVWALLKKLPTHWLLSTTRAVRRLPLASNCQNRIIYDSHKFAGAHCVSQPRAMLTMSCAAPANTVYCSTEDMYSYEYTVQ